MVVFKKKLIKRSGVRRSLDDDGNEIIVSSTTASEPAFTVKPVPASDASDMSEVSKPSEQASTPVVLNLDDLDESDDDTPRTFIPITDEIKITARDVANEYGDDYEDGSENKLRRGYSDDDVGIDIDGDDDTAAADSGRYHREVDAAPHQFPRVLNILQQISSLQNMRRLAEAKKLQLQQQEAETLRRLDEIAARKLELQRELNSW